MFIYLCMYIFIYLDLFSLLAAVGDLEQKSYGFIYTTSPLSFT